METMTSKEYRNMKSKKRSKYGNKKVEYKGMMFDSVKEYQRYVVLEFLLRRGQIRDLQRQVVFELIPKGPGVRRTTYVADFVYDDFELDGRWTHRVEDVKSEATRRNPVYRLKSKLMRSKYGITIFEV